jgi:hypothetical protein
MPDNTTKLLLLAGGAALLLWPGKAQATVAKLTRGQRLTTFSGRHDLYDRAFDQAYLPPARRPHLGQTTVPNMESPAEYYARLLPWQQSMLRPEMAKATTWPRMKQYYYKEGMAKFAKLQEGHVGVSFYTRDDVDFVAYDLKNKRNINLALSGLLYLEITTPEGVIFARVLDAGPSGLGRPVLDVSTALAEKIRPYWPSFVKYKLIDGSSTNLMDAARRMGDIKKNPDPWDISKERLPQPL